MNAFLAFAQIVYEKLLGLGLGDFEPRIDVRSGMAIADGPDPDRIAVGSQSQRFEVLD
jgi:hypothetical protein